MSEASVRMDIQVRDEAELLDFCKTAGLTTKQVATTLFGRGIHAIELPAANELPPIVVTAGSHATEPAGVLAALELATSLKVDRRVVIVPIRDPLGWEGYGAYLSLAAGREVRFANHEELSRLLEELGEIVVQDERLTIAVVGGIAFLSMPVQPAGRGPMDIWKHLHSLLAAQSWLVGRLMNMRLVLPENLPDVEGCGVYDHAFTAWVTPAGGVGNFNRLFSLAEPPVEVDAIAKLVRQLRPELVIDMHESQGSAFSIFAHPAVAPGTREIYFGATGAVFASGHEIESLRNLTTIIGADHAAKFVDHGGGVISGLNEFPGQGWQFTHLCAELGATTVTNETGRWQPLSVRVEQQLLSARGAIFAYLNAKAGGDD